MKYEDLHAGIGKASDASPFGVSWMDSWVAHWVYNETLKSANAHDKELATVLKNLVDLKFNERLGELRRFIRDYPRLTNEPPDGGPPEPGTPPAGPEPSPEPPDGGPPEPGVPPVPPTGPDEGFLGENPWILYWFISVKAPLLLEVIDAHITRRINDLRAQASAK